MMFSPSTRLRHGRLNLGGKRVKQESIGQMEERTRLRQALYFNPKEQGSEKPHETIF